VEEGVNMKFEDVKKVGVVGSGLMGNGIAQVVAAAGYDVVFCDVSMEVVDKGYQAILKRLEQDEEKGKITTEEKSAVAGRFTCTGNIESLSETDVIFEAIFENLEAKKDYYSKVDTVCKPETIFATNTSSLSITEIASATKRSDRFIGTHFFYPVPVMKLLEIIRGYDTSDETYRLIASLGEAIGKTTITVNEAPLFCVNRILVPMMNEAMFVLQEGIATREDIDIGMKLGTNHPIGPLALADLVGLDTLLIVMESLYNETRDSKYRPCTLLVKLVRAGHYGVKSGKGFYEYA
jgi:3-hydroxybutyryl-CoA dehydrogenase